MNIKTGLVAIVLLTILWLGDTQPANAERKAKNYSYTAVLMDERAGIQAYKAGDFSKAFERLKGPALHGLKQAQYLIAFMFLKGQHVDQSLIIGMGWLGVAKESKIKSWQSVYDQIYDNATIEKKALIDNKVAEYIEKFGSRTQKIKCVNRVPVGRKNTRIECNKQEGITPLYDIELTLANDNEE